MWRPLQYNVVAARYMNNHAIVAACGANNHVFCRLNIVCILCCCVEGKMAGIFGD
jgi:hypothetical protein